MTDSDDSGLSLPSVPSSGGRRIAPEGVYTAALIIIGNEILSGRTHDTNTPWIAERLTRHGILLQEVRVVPDVEPVIIRAVNEMRKTFDYVFTTGGIGPTHDDITAESIAKAFGVPVHQHEQAYKALNQHYGPKELTPSRLKMAMVPLGADLIPNPVSGAPGFIMENTYVMAGVPRIMQAMFDYILSILVAGKPILSHTITCDLAESVVADDLSTLQDRFPDVQIGSYPHYRGGVLGLSLVLRTTREDLLAETEDAVLSLLGRHGVEPRAISIKNDDI
ncbi:MAG: competence/damage-inducible protein A [Alphaproteobacteria bacterium]|nr:competence/damage-inducible protein A [Alphaproteobacteria bacterium]